MYLFADTIIKTPLPVRLTAVWATNGQQEKVNKRKQEQNVLNIKSGNYLLMISLLIYDLRVRAISNDVILG